MRLILTEEVNYARIRTASPELLHLLRGLLHKEPKLRLGNSERDAQEIKSHPFFASIDWAKLEKKEIEAPFKPRVQSESDVGNFDEKFTEEVPVDSPANRPRSVNFEKFTYTRESVKI